MADMAAPAPGQFDAQAPGVTAAVGSASQRLEGDLHALEQQLADLQVSGETTSAVAIFHVYHACLHAPALGPIMRPHVSVSLSDMLI